MIAIFEIITATDSLLQLKILLGLFASVDLSLIY